MLQAWALELQPEVGQQAWARAAAVARQASEQAQVRVQPVWAQEAGQQEQRAWVQAAAVAQPVSELVQAQAQLVWELGLLPEAAQQAWAQPVAEVRPVSEQAQVLERPV